LPTDVPDDDEPPRGPSVRRIAGSLTVRMPFVGGQVERAIVSGLREHLADETDVVNRWWRERD
jgi:hypothetical protein